MTGPGSGTPEASRELKTWIGFLAMCCGSFMAVLDTQIVASSLPDIAANLGSTMREASRIQTAYMTAEVIMIPLSGWLSRSLSLRYLYSLAIGLFTLTSLLCGIAWSIESLTVIRVFQGLCSGFLTPLLYQGIFMMFPRQRQPAVTLYVVLIVSFAPIIGPTLGGWITQTWSWRWLFLLNLAPGIGVTALAYGLVRGPEPQWNLLKRFDFPGILLAACFLGSLQYVLCEGPDRDWLDSGLIVLLLAVAAASALLLVWRELTCRYPVINLRTFRDRNFSTGCLFNFAFGFGLFGAGYLMTMFLSTVKGYNSEQIGWVMAVPGSAMLLSMPLVRAFRRNTDGRACLAIGLIVFAYSLWINSSLTAVSGYEHLLWPQVLRGMSMMFCLSAITDLALGRLPMEAVPNASGLYSLMRSLGGGMGIAFTNYFVEERTALHYRRLAESLDPSRFAEYVEQFQASFGSRMADLDQAVQGGVTVVAKLVRRESLVMACNDVWLVIATLFTVLFVLVPVVRKVER